MSDHPLRRLFAILFTAAFFSASMLQVMPAAAMPMGMDMDMDMDMDMAATVHGASPDSPPTPCKGMTPSCITDLGCVFMVGISIPAPQAVVRLSWFPVSYQWSRIMVADGRIRAPDLRPPIRLI